jgi:hypothetical protein
MFQVVMSDEIWMLVIFGLYLYIFYQNILLMIASTSVLQQPHGSIFPANGEEPADRSLWTISGMTDKESGSTRSTPVLLCPTEILTESSELEPRS